MKKYTEGKKMQKLLCYLAIFFCMAIILPACTKQKKQDKVEETPEAVSQNHAIKAIVTGIDKEKMQITARELDYDVDTILSYDERAVVIDKYGEEINADSIEVGEILNMEYTANEGRLVSANVPEDAWEYKQVEKFSFDNSESAMMLAGRKFQYSSHTFFADDGSMIDSVELNKRDILTVRGVGIKVYSVVRTKGHGYIRLKNYTDFIGGLVSVGTHVVLPIAKNMLITAREGTYRVTLSNKSLVATKTVTVMDGEESVLDFKEYTAQAKNVGKVVFDIQPEGADLYINNTAVDYSEPVMLNYGKYAIRVEMTGYKTYSGIISVEKPNLPLGVDLTTDTSTGDIKVTSSPSGNNSSDIDDKSDKGDADAPTTKKMDSRHTIKVTAPEGAEVYLDDVYKGLVPCSFTKIIGSQTITLSKAGYVTKSVSVDILDDGKNVTLSFGDLVEDDE